MHALFLIGSLLFIAASLLIGGSSFASITRVIKGMLEPEEGSQLDAISHPFDREALCAQTQRADRTSYFVPSQLAIGS